MSRRPGPGPTARLARAVLAVAAIAIAAGACSSAGHPAPGQRLQARATYERGLGYLQDRQPGPAVSALREAAALDASVPVYHATLGLVLLELGRPELAAEAFERALALDPGYADARMNLGIALAEQGRWRDAVAQYRMALSLPTLTSEAGARQNLGLALYHLGAHGEAESQLRFAIALEPRMEAAYYNLGLLLVATRRPAEAREAFQHVQNTAPQTPFGRAATLQIRRLDGGG